MTVLSLRFNADGLIRKLEELQRGFHDAPAILAEANRELAIMTAERAAAILKEREVGRPAGRTGALEEAIVDPGDYWADKNGFQLGIESFLDERTSRQGHAGYWREIEYHGVQAFDTLATFTNNYDRSGPYTRPGAGAGQGFMPQFGDFFNTGTAGDWGETPRWVREVHIKARAPYHPFELAGEWLTKARIFEAYRAAFESRGISLKGTNLGSRGAYVNDARITS